MLFADKASTLRAWVELPISNLANHHEMKGSRRFNLRSIGSKAALAGV
jgi:hypothetical protein